MESCGFCHVSPSRCGCRGTVRYGETADLFCILELNRFRGTRSRTAIPSSRLVFVLVIWIWVNLAVFFSASRLFAPGHICVKIGAESCTTFIQSNRRRHRTRLGRHLYRHTLQIYFLCCDFGVGACYSHSRRRQYTLSQSVSGLNEDIILDFCRFSYAINAPLCVLVKLLKRSICVLVLSVHGPPNFQI